MLVFVIGGGSGVVSACTVNENVAGTQILYNCLVYLSQSLGVENVSLIALADIALCLQLVSQLLYRLLIEVESRYLCARCRKGSCHSAADKSARAGHYYHLAGEIYVKGKIFHFVSP